MQCQRVQKFDRNGDCFSARYSFYSGKRYRLLLLRTSNSFAKNNNTKNSSVGFMPAELFCGQRKKLAPKVVRAFGVLSVVYQFGVEVVVGESVPGDCFPFGAGFAVVAIGVDGQSAAGEELAPDLDIGGVH